MLNFRKLAIRCAQIANQKKANQVIVLDVRGLTSLVDYLIICDGRSDKQIRSIVEAIEKEFKKKNIEIIHREGLPKANWVVLDYGGFFFHIFLKPLREFYNLERIWGEGKKINWGKKTSKSKRKKL